MPNPDAKGNRRTNGDIIFEALQREILSLKILPGTRISEAEVAAQFGLSRQPVRDAFRRLSNLGLLHIRPQRPTVVRHLSLDAIHSARFIRTAVEIEVLNLACRYRDISFDDKLIENLEAQNAAILADDAIRFHQLDGEFHQLLCFAGRAEFAFQTIQNNKSQVDRLCMLSLASVATMSDLLSDHTKILQGVLSGDARAVDATIRHHLGRLTPTVREIHRTHRHYFEN